MKLFAVKLTQYTFYLPLKILFFPFVTRNYSNLTLKRREGESNFVLAANHVSMLDPFLMCTCLPLSVTKVLMPYRFIVANAYYNNLFLRPGLWLLGGYRAYPHPSMRYGLELSYTLLDDNQTIMIFPEGKVNRTNGKLPSKRGVAELAKHKNTKIIPILITKNRSKIFKRFSVTFGKPEDMSKLDPEQIMQKVWDLAS